MSTPTKANGYVKYRGGAKTAKAIYAWIDSVAFEITVSNERIGSLDFEFSGWGSDEIEDNAKLMHDFLNSLPDVVCFDIDMWEKLGGMSFDKEDT